MSNNQIKEVVKIALVGSSWWSDAMYMPALDNHPKAEVVAVCGRNPERTQSFADTWEIPNAYVNFDKMLEEQDLGAVVIASANQTHYPYSLKAIEKGLHVLCEKPLGEDLAEAETMYKAAQDKRVNNMVPFTYRFMPTARYLKELIDDGYIGTPYHLNMRYYTGFARDGEYAWRFDPKESSSGVVGDIGSHWLYLARWYFGEIVSVSCHLSTHVKRQARPDGTEYAANDDSAMMLIEFENGAQGNIHVTAVCYEDTPFGQTHHMEFHGSEGTLYSFTDWDTVQEVSGAKVGEGAVKKLEIPEHIWGKARQDTVHNTYRDVFRVEDNMTRGFITSILEGTVCKPDFYDGFKAQQVIEAAILSHKEKQRIYL